jgi:hypothetical protein
VTGHIETIDCPCGIETRQALGGGRVQVHRALGEADGRPTESGRSPDRHCPTCDGWHLVGHPHFWEALREIEDEVYALPAEGRRHVGMFIERAAVVGLLLRRRKAKVA